MPKQEKDICFLIITSNNKSTLWFVQNKIAKIKLTTLVLCFDAVNSNKRIIKSQLGV